MSDKDNADKQCVTQNQTKNAQGLQQGNLVILSSLTESLLRVLEEFQHQLQTVMIPQSMQPGNQSSGAMSEAFNAVELLFNVLVYENDLKDHYKIQLSKLQTIYVKVAASDSSFYHQDSHPARQVLSRLVHAAKNASMNNQNSEDQVLEFVELALKNYDENPGIFAEILEQFKQKGIGHDKVLESCRQSSASLGNDIDIVVKAFINSTIQSSSAHGISESIKSFIQGPWQAYMYWIAMNQGVHGDAWEKAKSSLMDLISLCDPNINWDNKKRSEVFNAVSQEIEAAFNAIQMSQVEREQWLSNTINVLEQACHPGSSSIVSFAQEKLKDKAAKAKAGREKVNTQTQEVPASPEPEEAAPALEAPKQEELDDASALPPPQQNTPSSSAFDDAECEEIELTAPSPFGNSK